MTHEEMERKKRAILQSLAEGARAESAAPDEDDEEDGDIFVSTVTEAIALLLMHKEPEEPATAAGSSALSPTRSIRCMTARTSTTTL